MARPQGSVFIAASADGFIARRDGSIDWLDAVQRPGEDYGYQQFFDAVDALVIGRRTYDTVLGFGSWPYAKKRCVVLTHDAPTPRHGEEFDAGEPGALMERLGGQGVRRVYVDGGAVIGAFLRARLIDDLTVSVVPVLLGDGIRLFADDGVEQALTLVGSHAYDSGLVQLRYRVGA